MNKTSSDEGLSLMLGNLSSLREEKLKLREEKLKLREEKLQKLMKLSELDKELSKLQSGREGRPDTQETKTGNARKQQSETNWEVHAERRYVPRRRLNFGREYLSTRRLRVIEAQIEMVLAKRATIA